MEPAVLLSLIWANKEEIIGTAGAVVLAASTVAQYTPTDKDDRLWSRVGSLIDLLSGAVGKAAPRQISQAENIKNRPDKDAVRLLKHVITGKFNDDDKY